MNRLSLKKNFSWNFMANLVFAITQWGVLSTIAKLGTPTMVGQFSLGLAITAPVILLTNLQLRAVQATDAKVKYDFSEYLGLRVLTNVFALFIIILILWLGSYDTTTAYIVFIIGLSKTIDGVSDIIYGYLQQQERMDYPSKSKIIKGILMVTIVAMMLWITNNLFMSLVGMCLAYIISLLFYDVRVIKQFRNLSVSFNMKRLKGIVKLSYPLGFVLMLSSLYVNTPRIFLEKSDGLEKLGYFTAISYVLVAGSTFIGAVGQAVSPRMAKEFADGNIKAFQSLLRKSMMIGFSIGSLGFLIVLFFGDEILKMIYNSSYIDYHNIFILLMLSAIINFTGTFLGYGITATRSFKIQPILALSWVSVSTLLSFVLIPSFSMYGAAWVLIISAIVQFLVQAVFLIKRIKKANDLGLLDN